MLLLLDDGGRFTPRVFGGVFSFLPGGGLRILILPEGGWTPECFVGWYLVAGGVCLADFELGDGFGNENCLEDGADFAFGECFGNGEGFKDGFGDGDGLAEGIGFAVGEDLEEGFRHKMLMSFESGSLTKEWEETLEGGGGGVGMT